MDTSVASLGSFVDLLAADIEAEASKLCLSVVCAAKEPKSE